MSAGVLILLIWYFTPWLVAVWEGHPQKLAILALNLFLGWTLIGWVLALVWALTRQTGRA